MNTDKHRFFFRPLVLIPLFSLLTACERGPSTILDNTSCEPPCWNQIRPGYTSTSEALTRLENLPTVSAQSIYVGDELVSFGMDKMIYWEFRSGVTESNGRIYILKDRVALIALETSNTLKTEELVQRLGEPELVSAVIQCGDYHYLVIYMLYPMVGAEIVHYHGKWAE